MSNPLHCMAELLRLRARAREPLDLDEMEELAEALEYYGSSVASALSRTNAIRRPTTAIDIPPLPFSVINGGRTS